MSWQQLQFEIPQPKLETVETLLESLGALSITLKDAEDNPIFEPAPDETPLWQLITLTALFNEDTATQQIETALGNHADIDASTLAWEFIPDKDWARSWMDRFEPMQFGQRLWICPSWLEPPDPQAVNITLDPGLAFGSGTHETTAMCLQWLDANPPVNQTVIDYGCGSGILAIAAIKLGARQVSGVDIDPQALQASQENAHRNGVSAQQLNLSLIDSNANDSTLQAADLLMANILSGPLCELAPKLVAGVKPGGQIILSGILDSQADRVIQAYQPWIDLQLEQQQAEWVLLHGKRKAKY